MGLTGISVVNEVLFPFGFSTGLSKNENVCVE